MSTANILKKLSADHLLEAAVTALGASAAVIASMVQDELSQSPGQTDPYPATRTGRLASSIGVSVTGLRAVVGSTDPVAVLQELGTRHMQPRPFLTPAAADAAADAARMVGSAVHEAIGNGLTATL